MFIFGDHDDKTIAQMQQCLDAEEGALGGVCADGHFGYSQPIGGVAAYRHHISPSGVGYDIGCGNLAVKTDIRFSDLTWKEKNNLADEIVRRAEFGMGGKYQKPIDSPVIDQIQNEYSAVDDKLMYKARTQLGTVGSGNHYVDLLRDDMDYVWIGIHFGSRGFGHGTATGYLNLAEGKNWDEKARRGEMMSPPVLFDTNSFIGQHYINDMMIAGNYAIEGRNAVANIVLDILGNPKQLDRVHNHHNFAWKERHFGEDFWVVRKGATPAFPGQRGFVGGSMGDMCVILHGKESSLAKDALYSTVHGAGRIMSRNQAKKGVHQWVCPVVENNANCVYGYQSVDSDLPKNLKCPNHRVALRKDVLRPAINFLEVQDNLFKKGVVLRGAGPDESPEVYRPLMDVLAAHHQTIITETFLYPFVVVMAGAEVKDDYKD